MAKKRGGYIIYGCSKIKKNSSLKLSFLHISMKQNENFMKERRILTPPISPYLRKKLAVVAASQSYLSTKEFAQIPQDIRYRQL